MKNEVIATAILILIALLIALLIASIAVKLIGHAIDKEFKAQDNIVQLHKIATK